MARKTRNRTADYATYLAVRGVVAVVQMVSPRIAYAVADFLAWLAYTLAKGRRRVALDNVRAAFPELAANPAAADRLVRGMFRHLLRVVIELLLLPRKLHTATWRKYLAVPQGALTMPPLLNGRAALIVTAHFGSWELAGYALGLVGFRTFAIARVLDNPHLEEYLKRFRQATGQTIIAKKDDFDRLSAILQAGGKVATLGDQDAGPRGVFVDFFGRPASAHKAVALMAIEFDAIMVVVGAPRTRQTADGFYYEITCEDSIDPRDYSGRPDAVKAILTDGAAAAMNRFNRKVETEKD